MRLEAESEREREREREREARRTKKIKGDFKEKGFSTSLRTTSSEVKVSTT